VGKRPSGGGICSVGERGKQTQTLKPKKRSPTDKAKRGKQGQKLEQPSNGKGEKKAGSEVPSNVIC